MWLSLLALPLAQESSDEDTEEQAFSVPVMEVLVESERNEAEARKELDQAIEAQGYLPGIPLGKRTFFMPWKIWEPRITVHEEGMVRVKARAVQPMFVLPTWPPLIVGVWDSPRKARGMESRVLMAIDPQIDSWRLAMSTTGQLLRREQLRASVESLLGSELSEAEQHRVWIALWRNTAENAEGEAVRVYLEELAERAGWVFSQQELELANRDRGFLRPLDNEALGADFVPPPVDWTVERLARPVEPECPEPVETEKTPQGLGAEILTLRAPEARSMLWDVPAVRTMATAGDWATDNGLLPDQPQDLEFDDPCR